MIRFEQQEEPGYFNDQIRIPGNHWLAANPNSKTFPDYWRGCRDDLAMAFHHLCAYAAMYIPEGEGCVDHFLEKINPEHRTLVYEWTNYRFAGNNMNSRRKAAGINLLDPFLVQDNWFEITLPSLQLVRTDEVPILMRPIADFTIDHFNLVDDPRIIARRKAWLDMYEKELLSLEGLRLKAPLLARAVEKRALQDIANTF